MSSPHDTPFIVVHDGGRGPGTNVGANPVLGTGTMPTSGSTPSEGIDHHTVGPKPRIHYQPGTVDETPDLSIGNVHTFNDDPTRPPSTAPIGGLGPSASQGIQPIDGIGDQASGIRVDLTTPSDDIPLSIRLPGLADAPPDPPTSSLGPTSPIAGTPPWHQQGQSDTPAPATSATTQVWPGRTVSIGTNTPWPGTQAVRD